MTIVDSFKVSINNAFKFTTFWGRDKVTIKSTLNKTANNSDNVSLVPKIERLEVEHIDDAHDKLTIIYDDVSFSGIATWKPSSNGRNFVFLGIE